MKAENKMPCIYNHIELIEEIVNNIKKDIKWVDYNIKVIKKHSKPKD